MDDQLQSSKLCYACSRSSLEDVACDERTIAHMCFFEDVTRADTYELGNKSIEQIAVVARLVCLRIREKIQIDQSLIRHVIEGKEVCAGFF